MLRLCDCKKNWRKLLVKRWRNEDGNQNLQSGADPRVSIACLTGDTDHLIKKNPNSAKHVNSVVMKNRKWGKQTVNQLFPLEISSRICFAFLLNFKKGIGCLITPFEICFNIWIFEPPWFIILRKREIADGRKSSYRSVQRDILRNSDMIEP